MKRQGGGRIVNMSSVVAREVGSASSFAYVVAKDGVSTLTSSMVKQLVVDGILANAVAPGRIDTPFHEDSPPPKKERQRRRRYH